MADTSFSKFIIKRLKFVFGVTLLVTLATLTFSIVQPVKYRSRIRLLVLQEYSSGVDPYNIAKATEYFSDLLAEVASSKLFFDEVLQDRQIDRRFFSPSPQRREKQWKKMVSARTIGDTGILIISVYHPVRSQAEIMASAIATVFTTKGALFHGAGERLNIRVIDEPITSEKPIQPRILLNTIVGAIIGFLLGLGIVFFFPLEGMRLAVKIREETL